MHAVDNTQNSGKGDQPIAYLSKKLSGAEQNWPAHEQELYAVVNALKHWKYYLLGSRFDVYTDSIALKTIMTQQNLSRKQFRWVMELQEFFVVLYALYHFGQSVFTFWLSGYFNRYHSLF
jgi:ribonuclease HI